MSTFVQSGWITVRLFGMPHRQAELWVLRTFSLPEAPQMRKRKMTKKKAKRPRATKRRRKSPLFLDAAREDAKMLSAITDREIFQRVVEVVLADWTYHQQEDAFADWFESVYLCDA
jgi:hypothetical protein